jgi:hypothetical protein
MALSSFEVDKTLRDEQAGFKQERSCVDQIATQNNCRANNRMTNFSQHEFYRF